MKGGTWTVRDGEARPQAAPLAKVALSIRIAKQAVFSNPSDAPTNSVASNGRLIVYLAPESNSWLVIRVDALG